VELPRRDGYDPALPGASLNRKSTMVSYQNHRANVVAEAGLELVCSPFWLSFGSIAWYFAPFEAPNTPLFKSQGKLKGKTKGNKTESFIGHK